MSMDLAGSLRTIVRVWSSSLCVTERTEVMQVRCGLISSAASTRTLHPNLETTGELPAPDRLRLVKMSR